MKPLVDLLRSLEGAVELSVPELVTLSIAVAMMVA